MIEVVELVVRYGPKVAVGGVSFAVGAGSVLALLGPNGAGKTSTVEVCEGFRPPSAGRVLVLGKDPWLDHDKVMPHVGVMLQSGGVYPAARTGQALGLLASFAAEPLDVRRLAELLGLTGVLRTEYRRLSGGEKQRLHLAMAIVGRPAVVFLDEPTAGMDVAARHTTWTVIERLRRSGVGILLTTHLLDEAERLADQVVIMRDGRVAVAGSPADLRAALPETTVVETALGEYEIGNVHPEQLAPVIGTAVDWCTRQGSMITDIHTVRPSLEDIFRAVTGQRS